MKRRPVCVNAHAMAMESAAKLRPAVRADLQRIVSGLLAARHAARNRDGRD